MSYKGYKTSSIWYTGVKILMLRIYLKITFCHKPAVFGQNSGATRQGIPDILPPNPAVLT